MCGERLEEQRERLATVLSTAVRGLGALAILYSPVLPKATQRLWDALGGDVEAELVRHPAQRERRHRRGVRSAAVRMRREVRGVGLEQDALGRRHGERLAQPILDAAGFDGTGLTTTPLDPPLFPRVETLEEA